MVTKFNCEIIKKCLIVCLNVFILKQVTDKKICQFLNFVNVLQVQYSANLDPLQYLTWDTDPHQIVLDPSLCCEEQQLSLNVLYSKKKFRLKIYSTCFHYNF